MTTVISSPQLALASVEGLRLMGKEDVRTVDSPNGNQKAVRYTTVSTSLRNTPSFLEILDAESKPKPHTRVGVEEIPRPGRRTSIAIPVTVSTRCRFYSRFDSDKGNDLTPVFGDDADFPLDISDTKNEML
ncbi:hypothetical protein EVAR_55442_1 [Eumeta japonica]|uniref:Uncharacterized protein n=1 Tax=Eumeta variegata TaxID=151549 RepID=A0A4C1Y427_EUMVA|nr:hypothetical protein EVAR_55442_1 [Eumeta japonica]